MIYVMAAGKLAGSIFPSTGESLIIFLARVLISMQRRELKEKRQHQRRCCRRKPPNPLIGHVLPRNPEPKTSRRVHLRPGVAREDAARGERDEAQAAAREERN